MDRPPPEPNQRPLAAILADPSTEWRDIREGIRKGRRGSATAVTNGGAVAALKESLRESAASGSTGTAATSSLRGSEWSASVALRGSEWSAASCVGAGTIPVPGDYDEGEGDAERKRRLLGAAAEGGTGDILVGGGDGRGPVRNPSRAMVRGKKIEEVAFNADSSEGEDSSIAFTDSSGLDSSKEKRLERDDDSQGSKKGCGSFCRAQRRPSTRRSSRRVPFGGRDLQDFKGDPKADSDKSASAEAKKGELHSGRDLQDFKDDPQADSDESTSVKATKAEPRRRPSRRRPSRMSSSHRVTRDNSIHFSSLFRSDSRITVTSFQDSTCSDSVDMMDFGVDHARRSTNQVSSNSSSDSDSMSNFVDSDGFLGWGSGRRGSSSDPPTSEDEKDVGEVVRKRAITGRRDSLKGSKALSLSHFVDNEGFLGWGNNSSYSMDSTASDDAVAEDQNKGNNCSCSMDSTASDYAVAEDRNKEKKPFGKGQNTDRRDLLKRTKSSPSLSNLVDSTGFLGLDDEKKLDEEESNVSPAQRCESWNIEDYEDSDGCAPPSRPQRRGLFRSLSRDMLDNLLTSKDPKVEAGEPKEGIGTDAIKRILLKGHPSFEAESPGGTAGKGGPADAPPRKSLFGGPLDAPLHKYLFRGMRRKESLDSASSPTPVDPEVPLRKSLFGGMMRRRNSDGELIAASSAPCEAYYSRPAIRINREDGVDIGELRRELLLAGIDKVGVSP